MPVGAGGDEVFGCRGVSVVLDGVTVLDQVDFTLSQGEFVALLGDNGAGKSTLVKALLRLVPIESGSVSVFHTDLRRFRGWARIGYVPQRLGAVSPVPASVVEVVLSGRAGLARPLPGYGRRDHEMARTALEVVKLAESMDRPVASLSGGQQQRVLIARALSRDPEVLVLDEPAAGIDAESEEALAGTLDALSREGRSILMVAHGLGAVASLVSRTVVLQSGKVAYDGPPLGAGAGFEHLHIHHHPEGPEKGTAVFHQGARPPR